MNKIVKVTAFVQSQNDFHLQHLVVNGFSELVGEIFGPEVGAHSRSAVGVNALPLGVPVEIEMIVRFT